MLHLVETGIVLLAAVLALTTVARRLLVPYPILLVIGGLVIAMIPGLPPVRLHPDLVFLVFLPPVLWAAAYFTSLREFRQNLRPISLLAIGLVLATTAAVAAVARAGPARPGWPAALALGAIVSPPDAVAATAVARKLVDPAPRDHGPGGREPRQRRHRPRACIAPRWRSWSAGPSSSGKSLAAVRAERGGRRRDRDRRRRRRRATRSASPTRASAPSPSPCSPPTWPGSSPRASTRRPSSPAWPGASTSASTSAPSSRPSRASRRGRCGTS